MSIVLSGSTGYIGRRLMEHEPKILRTEGDLATGSFIVPKATTAIHMAGKVGVRANMKGNWLIDTNFFNALVQNGTNNLVIVSTSQIYGNVANPYAVDMMRREVLACSLPMNVVILRVFNVGGWFECHRGMKARGLIRTLIEHKINGTTADVYGNCTRDYVDLDDVCSAILKAVERPKELNRNIIQIGSFEPIRSEEIAQKVGAGFVMHAADLNDPNRLCALRQPEHDVMDWNPTKGIDEIIMRSYLEDEKEYM